MIAGSIDQSRYKSLTFKFMRGKKGAIRSMSSIRVEGSARAVISVASGGTEGSIFIPESIAFNIIIPVEEDRVVVCKCLQTGDYCLLIRQPCLWSRGIQPVKVFVTNPSIMSANGLEWDVNQTIKLPPGISEG